jgi:hypothetical protein
MAAKLGKCPYWQAGYANPSAVRDHKQNVLGDGTVAGNWNILNDSNQILESVSYTSQKQRTTETSLSGKARGPCPYWENSYGNAPVQRSHTQYQHGGSTIGEFKLLNPSEGTLQTIKYTSS